MPSDPPKPVSQLLERWHAGDAAALEAMVPLVYDELRRIAGREARRELAGHTLQCTALVHEAYLRLAAGPAPRLQSREHFFGVAARLMRQILVDKSRARRAAKRDAGLRVTLGEQDLAADEGSVDVEALSDALDELARLEERQARIVELRFFGGLSIEETSSALKLSPATVKRDWTAARLWLHRELNRAGT